MARGGASCLFDEEEPKTEEPSRDAGPIPVLLPMPFPGPFDYAPGGDVPEPGRFVRVPLGPRQVTGVVWDRGGNEGGRTAPKRLKPVSALLDFPPLPADMRRFIDWVADYYMAPPGMVLRMAMRVPDAIGPPRERPAYRLGHARPERMTAARERVLTLMEDGLARRMGEIAELAGVSAAVVRGLVQAGALERVAQAAEAPVPVPLADGGRVRLSSHQQGAGLDLARRLQRSVEEGRAGTVLLEGVTGSGKTEVYFEAIAACLRAGRQVMVLLPEIALTEQWLERFRSRFGVDPLMWHSDIRPSERRRVWRGAISGAARVVVGARSALFLPFCRLGLIIADEEHDSSFKQEEGVRYHARDMAVLRGHLAGAPVILSSATPSLETVFNVRQGKYGHLRLTARHGGASMPRIDAIDLRAEEMARNQWISPSLAQAMADTLAAGEQVALFLNRRGYAPLTLCGACGFRLQCPHCSAWLVEHRARRRLCCHHCGHAEAIPRACPDCGAEDTLKPCGPGVERVMEEAAALFPEARVMELSSDTAARNSELRAVLRAMDEGRIDILVGTQIIAKGHHFPMLTLVGVIDADLGLEGGDLRASERTYQLLSQMAGRAGRAERPGRVLLQTHEPDQPVIRALVEGDGDGFIAAELAARHSAGMPPFGRLAAIILSAEDQAQVSSFANSLARRVPHDERIRVLGPGPAPLALIRGRHRYRFLVQGPREVLLQPFIRRWLDACPPPRNLRLDIDIDPQSFM